MIRSRSTLMRELGLVALGGAVGAAARYGLGLVIAPVGGFPLQILLANVTGAFLLGWLTLGLAQLGDDTGRRRGVRLLLGTGVLGGYTTYSSLATDAARLLLGDPAAQAASAVATAVAYGLITLLLGGFASWLGVIAGQRVRSRGSASGSVR